MFDKLDINIKENHKSMELFVCYENHNSPNTTAGKRILVHKTVTQYLRDIRGPVFMAAGVQFNPRPPSGWCERWAHEKQKTTHTFDRELAESTSGHLK